MEALYLPDGDGFVGTDLTQGGWDPRHQHGGPVQGLIARCVSAVPTLTPQQITRLTFDMVRPVPIGPRLDVATRVLRQGKKIQLVEASLTVGDVEHVRGTALRLRVDDMGDAPLPVSTADERSLPAPETVAPMHRDMPNPPGFLRGMDMRRFPVPGRPEGQFGYWIRLTRPLVAGEDVLPISRLGVAGDFTNGIGVLVEWTAVTTINADVSVEVLRPPAGEWVGLVGDTRFALDRGIGISTAELHDTTGLCAIATTSQLVQRR